MTHLREGQATRTCWMKDDTCYQHGVDITRPLVPILRSPMLFLHVGTIMLSYILLVVSIVRRDLLRPAVFLLATGIFLGAVWANISWGTYWSWEPLLHPRTRDPTHDILRSKPYPRRHAQLRLTRLR